MDRQFFARDAADVARDLLGCDLVHDVGSELRGRVVETEAYHGEGDPASHAASGRTERNAPMFGPAGNAYVYIAYGLHTLLNVVTGEEGVPSAVLLRAVEPVNGLERMRANRGVEDRVDLCSGPGKLCEALEIGTEYNGVDLTAGHLRIEGSEAALEDDLAVDTRIGVSGGEDLELRYYLEGNRFVSR